MLTHLYLPSFSHFLCLYVSTPSHFFLVCFFLSRLSVSPSRLYFSFTKMKFDLMSDVVNVKLATSVEKKSPFFAFLQKIKLFLARSLSFSSTGFLFLFWALIQIYETLKNCRCCRCYRCCRRRRCCRCRRRRLANKRKIKFASPAKKSPTFFRQRPDKGFFRSLFVFFGITGSTSARRVGLEQTPFGSVAQETTKDRGSATIGRLTISRLTFSPISSHFLASCLALVEWNS